MQNRKTIIIFAILALVIGFASITTILNITGRTSVGFDSEKFASDVIFTSSVLDGDDVTETTIKENGKKIEFTSRTLTTPGEQVILDYIVTNNSTQYAGRATVKVTKFNEDYLTIENTPMTFDLAPGSDEPGQLIITLKKSVEDDINIEIEVEIDVDPIYPEDVTTSTTTSTTTTETTTTTEEEDPEDEGKQKFQVTIDPAGGLYNGLSDIVNTEVVEGKTVTLSKVIREGYIFRHWLVNDQVLSGNTVTITEETRIVAVWADESEAVARIDEELYLTIQSAFDDAKDNDIVELLKSTEEIATNEKKVTLDLKEFTVTGQIINEGNLTIINGTIENTDGTAIINSGTLTIGNNNDEEVSTTIPAIIGTDKGIENTGIFNFYDGYIEAKMWLDGNYNSIPIDYSVFVDHNDDKNCQKTYLVKDLNTAIVENREPYIYYRNLQDAIRSSEESGKNIYARKDFETAYELSVSKNKTIYFDIVGYEVEFGYTVRNDGTLTITNSNTETGIIKPSVTITNNGTLNIKDIEITETTSANVITNNGILNIENSTITGLAGYAIDNVSGTEISLDENTYLYSDSYAFNNQSPTELTITNGNIRGIRNSNANATLILDKNINATGKSGLYALYNYAGVVTINGGNYESDNNTTIYNDSTMEIYGGTITSNYSSSAISNGGTMTIYDIKINSSSGISNSSSLIFKDGEINTKGVGISQSMYGSTNIYGGSIISESSYAVGGSAAGIYIYDGYLSGTQAVYVTSGSRGGFSFSSSVYMYGGTLAGGDYGIYAPSSSNLYIYGGTVIGGKYGVYDSYSGNKIEVGDKTKEVPDLNPVIEGDLYGVYSSAHKSIPFYSGILKGKTGSYIGDINVIPAGYQVFTSESDEYISSYLTALPNYLSNGNIEYNSLQLAINQADSGDTIQITSNVSVIELVTIPSGKKIVLDLNGKEFKLLNKITNNGELEIIDSSDNKDGLLSGSTRASVGTFISNGTSAKLTVTSARITSIDSSTNYLMYGGEVNLYDADIYGDSYLVSCTTCNINDSTLKTGRTAVNGTTVTIDSSDIISNDEYAIDTSNLISISGASTINDTTIESSNNKTAVYKSGSSILEINNTNITTAGSYGISMSGASVIVKGDSKIISEMYGVYASSGTNTLTLGVDDDKIDTTIPLIQGTQYAIFKYNNASYVLNINFYDGVLKGKTDTSNTPITSMPEATTTLSTTEDIGGETYKVEYLQDEDMIVSYNEKEYNSLNKVLKAIEEDGNEGRIELINNANITYEWTIPEDMNITVDLQGHSLTFTKIITNNGVLNFADSTKSGSIEKIGTGYAINSYNDLSFEDVDVTFADNGIMKYSGELSLTNSNITNSGTYNINMDTGTIDITNSNIVAPTSSTKYAIYIKNGTITLNSGYINGYYAVYMNGTADLVQQSGEIKGYYAAIYISSTSSYRLVSGEISGGRVSNSGTFIMDSGTINGYVSNGKDFTMNGGTIIYSSEAISNGSAGTVNINKGKITSTGSYGIDNSGTLNLGIDNDDNGKIEIAGGTYGLYVSSGTVNIGINNSKTEEIEIIGGTYGIYSTGGTINYYDGIIKGKTDRIRGYISSIPENKMLYYDVEEIENEENGNIIYYTCKLIDEKSILSIGNKDYANLTLALEEVKDNETILLKDDVQVIEKIDIDKNITIDLNGNDLYIISAYYITNNGALTITNSNTEKESYIHKIHNNRMFDNKGTLAINNINIDNSDNGYRNNYLITNSGTLNITDSNISTDALGINSTTADSNININSSSISASTYNSSCYTIRTEGNLTIDEGNIKGYYAVYNYNDSVVSVSNSTFSGTSYYSYKASSFSSEKNTYITSLSLGSGDYIATSTADTIASFYNNAVTTLNNPTISESISNSKTLELNNPILAGSLSNSGTLTINGGTTKSTIGNSLNIYVYDLDINTTGTTKPFNISGSGETIFDGVTINSTVGGDIAGSGTVTFEDCDITVVGTTNGIYGIKTSGTSTTVIDNTNVTVQGNSSTVYGVNADAGTINIVDGEIKAKYTGTSTSTSYITYGIYINNADVSMGTEGGGEPSQEKPYIEAISGTAVGIGVKKVNGYFKFFDGKIVGSTNAKPDTTTLVEPKYKAAIANDPETGYEYCVLVPE